MFSNKHMILDEFNAKFNIKMTKDLVNSLNRMVVQFEIRDEHPYTLNSQIFGDKKFFFMKSDRDMLFSIIGIDEQDVSSTIASIPSINNEFKVISDPLNLMATYLVHKVLTSTFLNNKDATATAINILNYVQYRMMSSAVNHYFPYGVDHDIMLTVVENLNLKFYIKQYGTWKKVLSARSESIITEESGAHTNTLRNFDDDQAILYLISDTSTRIRSQLKIIVSSYYEIKEASKVISSHSSTTILDGEKVLREKKGSFELVSSTIIHKILSRTQHIDQSYISLVQSSVPRLSTGIIIRAIHAIADEARMQNSTGSLDKVVKRKDGSSIILGVAELIRKLIIVVYTTSMHDDRVKMNSKIMLYNNTRNIFTSSRTISPDLLLVRVSLEDLIKRTKISSRATTVSGLVTAITLFFTLTSFESL